MRDATQEERACVNAYIKSISKNTGINFFDEQRHLTEEENKIYRSVLKKKSVKCSNIFKLFAKKL